MLSDVDRRLLRLLEFAPIERRSRAWRFGARTFSDVVVERLIASGVARVEGAWLHQVIAISDGSKT